MLVSNKDLISIIIPIHNSSKYLEEAIKSINSQTYENYEAIFIDDNSKDDSLKIVEEYAQKNARIKIIKLKRHMGVSTARNIGIRAAKGNFLTFLDSDDIWDKDKLKLQLEFIKNKNCELIYCSFCYMTNDSNKISKPIKIKEKVDYENALLDIRILTITVMLDLNKIPKRYCYFPKSKIEDTVNWFSILRRGYVAYGQNVALAYCRISKKSRSSNKFEMAFYRWNTYRRVEKLGFFKSIYCFINYAVNALFKRLNKMRPREVYKDIEVLVAAQNLNSDTEIDNLVRRMKISSKYLIINQNQNDVSIKNENVIIQKGRGVSKSRNFGFKYIDSEIVCLADDDMIYNDNYKKIILDAHNKYKTADIICFYVESKNKNRKTKRFRTKKIDYINANKIFNPEITIKVDSLKKYSLAFNEMFGSGTKIDRGEEQIFLFDALNKGLNLLFVNKKIGEVDQNISSWYTEMDKEFFHKQGLVYKHMSPNHYKLWCYQYAVRKYFQYRKCISFTEAIKEMIE